MSTFGSSSAQGGGTDNPSSNWVWLKASSTPASSGTLTNIHIWCSQISAGNIGAALYSDTAGSPDALIAANDTGVSIPVSAGDAAVPLSASIVAGTQYWFAVRIPTGGAADAAVDYGSASGTELYFKSSSGNFPATFPTPDGSDNTERWTVWGEYTPSGGDTLMGQILT
jgi:hypothetical protein